ncbi:hypothetical protein AABC73_11840 [Pseudomonas sp. G.S.17]|uniref:hypothetical protein n=1 Tax=Pseudomonas sp. G.S.17 TaxID=3137451 RepID=UPI00311C9122
MTKQQVYFFWGVVDLLCVWWFVYWNLSNPTTFLYGAYMMMIYAFSPANWLAILGGFIVPVLLNLSLALSMFMFFSHHRWAHMVAFVQAPFRLYFFIPSLPFMPWVNSFFGLKKTALIFFIFLLVEVIKLLSISRVNAVPVGEPE